MFTETMTNSLHHLLLNNEKEQGNQVYLKQPRNGVWQELTWAQVMNQARKVAGFLQKLGLEKGSHISIISKNCAEWFITDFGIHLAGMVNVPLFSNQYKESIHYVLDHAEVKLVFVGKLDDHQQVRDFIPEQYVTVGFDYHLDLKLNYHWSDVLACDALMDLVEPKPEDLYTIIYSSGTTGSPKGAMYTNQSIANYLTLFPTDLFRVRHLPHYHLVSYLPLAHVYERSAIQLASLTIPCDVAFIESLDKFAANLQYIQPTLFTAVPRIWGVFQQKIEQKMSPSLLRLLLKIPFISTLIKKKIVHGLGLNSCTNSFSGASHLPASITRFFEKLGIYIQEGYGQTENMAYATLTLLSDRKSGFVGTPRLEVEVKLSEEGELLVHSPCFMSGYYKEEQATLNSFTTDGWLRTGDVAELDDLKHVKIVGRISENFKNQSGEYIAPSPIEKKFETKALKNVIEQLCLVGRGLPHNVLLIKLNDGMGRNTNKEEINGILQNSLRQVNSSLAKYEKISNIIIVKDTWTTNNNLLTPTLKVKRKMVEQFYTDLIQQSLMQQQTIIWE
jgi:long-chain acyl-CoA synthetase